MKSFQDISYTFSIAKLAAILTIFTAHYFGGMGWVPATVALFIMAWSSGFFTACKYMGEFNLARFWRAKIERLGYRLLIVDIFLCSLLLLRQQSGLWSWQTIWALLGLNGFLHWFNIPNPSPLGAGLWFLTLLWLFYLVYPVLERFNRKRAPAIIFIATALVVSMKLYHWNRLDHMLWMTLFAFLFGVFSARYRLRVRAALALLVGGASAVLLVEHNLWAHIPYPDYHLANYTLILIGSIAAIHLLLEIQLPRRWFDRFLPWSGCVLEFYMIHFYFLAPWQGLPKIVSYGVSLIITIALAWLLNWLQEQVRSRLKRQAIPQGQA